MIEIQCTQCKAFIARYKGSGKLDLLLLDKVIKPIFLKELGSSAKADLPLLICTKQILFLNKRIKKMRQYLTHPR